MLARAHPRLSSNPPRVLSARHSRRLPSSLDKTIPMYPGVKQSTNDDDLGSEDCIIHNKESGITKTTNIHVSHDRTKDDNTDKGMSCVQYVEV